MVEILVLLALTRNIGGIVEVKGRKPGPYKLLTVVLWFGGELLGALAGFALAGAGDGSTCLVYAFALGGAGIGALIAFAIANRVTPLYQPSAASAVDSASGDGTRAAR